MGHITSERQLHNLSCSRTATLRRTGAVNHAHLKAHTLCPHGSAIGATTLANATTCCECWLGRAPSAVQKPEVMAAPGKLQKERTLHGCMAVCQPSYRPRCLCRCWRTGPLAPAAAGEEVFAGVVVGGSGRRTRGGVVGTGSSWAEQTPRPPFSPGAMGASPLSTSDSTDETGLLRSCPGDESRTPPIGPAGAKCGRARRLLGHGLDEDVITGIDKGGPDACV